MTRPFVAGLVVLAVVVTLGACATDDTGTGTGTGTGSATIVSRPDPAPTPPAPTDDTGSLETSTTVADTSDTDTSGTDTSGTDTSVAPVPPTSTAPPATMGDPSVVLTEVARLDRPVGVAVRPGDPRTWIIGQGGPIVTLDESAPDGARVVTDLSTLTVAQGERGLLGLAFSPDGTEAYVNRTDADGDTIVEAYPVGDDGSWDLDGRRELLVVEQPFGNHNGGHLLTLDDGTLVIGTGDGGSAGDPLRLALDPTSLHGKLLRIDPRPDPADGTPYGIPTDNPFVGDPGVRPEVFAVGLRNPWKFSIDPDTGDLWIADVGQNAIEEINRVPGPADGALPGAGASYGWSAFEGLDRFNDDQPAEGHVDPVLVYAHGDDGCSVTGGAVYRGDRVPELAGGYVYGDFCSGRLWALDLTTGRNLRLPDAASVTAVLPGADGELYVTSHGGRVFRIDPA